MAVVQLPNYTHKYTCLSTDTKPTDDVPNGSICQESDTGKEYKYNGSAWFLSNRPAVFPTAVSGIVTVTTAGDDVTLGDQEVASGVTIIALPTNTAGYYVYVYPIAGTKAANAIKLAPGASITWPVNNISALTLDADNDGDGIMYLGAN